MRLYRTCTAPHLGAQIIVWPESAIPALESNIRELPRQRARRGGRARLARWSWGCVRTRSAAPATTTTRSARGRRREQWYYKRRLVPFGEFFPVPAVGARLDAADEPAVLGFRRRLRAQAPLQAAGGRRSRRRSATKTPTASSSSRSRGARRCSSTSPTTHGSAIPPRRTSTCTSAACARWRPGRPMLRATNDGVTALIADDGR